MRQGHTERLHTGFKVEKRKCIDFSSRISCSCCCRGAREALLTEQTGGEVEVHTHRCFSSLLFGSVGNDRTGPAGGLDDEELWCSE